MPHALFVELIIQKSGTQADKINCLPVVALDGGNKRVQGEFYKGTPEYIILREYNKREMMDQYLGLRPSYIRRCQLTPVRAQNVISVYSTSNQSRIRFHHALPWEVKKTDWAFRDIVLGSCEFPFLSKDSHTVSSSTEPKGKSSTVN